MCVRFLSYDSGKNLPLCVATYFKQCQIRVTPVSFWFIFVFPSMRGVFVDRLLADAYCTDYTIVVRWAAVRAKFSCLSLRIWLDGLSWSAVESCVLTIRLSNDLSESDFYHPIIGTCVRGIRHCLLPLALGHFYPNWLQSGPHRVWRTVNWRPLF